MRESSEDASQLQLHIWKQDLTLEAVTRFQRSIYLTEVLEIDRIFFFNNKKQASLILIRLVQEKLIKMLSLRKTQEDSQDMA